MPNCVILSDALNQNSMIEEVRRSGSEKKIWRQSYIDLSEQIAHDIDIAEATVEVRRTRAMQKIRATRFPSSAKWPTSSNSY